MDINFLALTHFNKLFLILNRFLWFLYIMELVFFLIFTFFVHRWAASDILAQDKQAFLPIENKTCPSYKIKKWLIIIKTVHSVLNSHQENLAGKGCSISQWNWQNWYFSSFIGGRLTYFLIGKPLILIQPLLGNGEGGVNLFLHKLKSLDFIFYRNDVKLVKEWVKLFSKYDLLILSIISKLELALETNQNNTI